MDLKIQILSPTAKVPAYATPGAAGLDLAACIGEAVTLLPMQSALIPTGLAIAVPQGYVGLIYARSGLAIKHGITLSNCVGVIDSDYTGELRIGLINLGSAPYTIHGGDRIAQLVLSPAPQASLCVVEQLTETERGAGGFGSTGK